MNNQTFFIQYLSNQPVKIETHIDSQLKRREFPLTDVGGLVAAYKTAVAPLLDHSSLAHLTLHSKSNGGLETNYNSWDPLTALEENGRLGTNPLIIKSKKDAGQGIFDSRIVQNRMQFHGSAANQAFERLVRLICLDDGIFYNPRDYMKTINLEQSVLNLNIQSLDGIPDLRYSEEIYDCEKQLGIEMPIDKLLRIKRTTVVLIGASGCGKTRTCYDLCRNVWGLYFDCAVDTDFAAMIGQLDAMKPRIKTIEAQEYFERDSTRRIECLFATRLLVLQTVRKLNPNLTFFDWLCIQRSRRTQCILRHTFMEMEKLPWSVSSEIYRELKSSFIDDNGRIIFDEAQYLLEILKNDYRANNLSRSYIRNGKIGNHRSFFSFLSKYFIQNGLTSWWCGTDMRIRRFEPLSTAAGGGKNPEPYIFTDFNFLEPHQIFKLLSKWVNVEYAEINDLLHEISVILQGRPKILASFLHSLIDSSDINKSFRFYVKSLTTNYESALSSLVSRSSFYCLWREGIDWTIEPTIERDFRHEDSASQTRFVSETLIKLCLSYLFGDGCSIAYRPDLALVSTSLVKISKELFKWNATMAEPIVLCAGLNFLADQNKEFLMDYFAKRLFPPLNTFTLAAQERGHMMKLFIALRFMQGWWLEPNLEAYLPKWARDLKIAKPKGVLDCRSETNFNTFVQQLRNPSFPWLILPPVNAGPDFRYSIFCCEVKTTFTANSQASLFVVPDEYPRNWCDSQESVQGICLAEIKNEKRKFIHIRFELPDTAPSMKDTFINRENGDDYIICVNLDSEFAGHFFGNPFIEKYREFSSRLLSK